MYNFRYYVHTYLDQLELLQNNTYVANSIQQLNVVIMFSLLLLSSLLHITTCTVYTVTPDDHYYPNTTCHHCHNLQHYLLNVTKYFTSNTQLLFLPGLHHLHTDLIIQNVHNISLVGSRANDTPDTFIQLQNCTKCISMIYITNLTIQNILFKDNYLSNVVLLTIQDCSFVSLHHLIIYHYYAFNYNALLAINIMGNSIYNHVMCFGGMQLIYNETHTQREHHSLSMNKCTVYALYISMSHVSYKVTLTIINIQARRHAHVFKSLIRAEIGTNEVLIINCRFVPVINYPDINHYNEVILLSSKNNGSVQFTNCQFINNAVLEDPGAKYTLMRIHESIIVEYNDCDFYGNNENQILETYGHKLNSINLVIRNTVFTADHISSIFSLSYTTLILADSVSFHNITTFINTNSYNIISLEGNSKIIISGTVKFLYNHVPVLIDFYKNNIKYIVINENGTLVISHNKVWSFFCTNLPTTKYPYPFCIFQYFTNSISKLRMEKRNFLIRFHNNLVYNQHASYLDYMPTVNCRWLPKSSFSNRIPLEVNDYYIQFINNSGTYKLSQITEQSSLCVCTNESHHDCHISNLGYLYPGQILTISLYHQNVDTANAVAVKTDIYQQYVTPCIVLDISENLQLIDKRCTELHYTIGFPTENWCELFLKIASDSDEYLNIFHIRQITCPTGFVKIDKRCQCDPLLVQHGIITNCNINDQTILRPANSWISATTHNNSYTYHISLHCPFHFCLPHSSYLNFSTPNSQCQFNRSGLLCGHCQQGLSTVFSSFQCQYCSSVYILLVLPIAVAGLFLVLLLFVLNLTVTDGIINGFILYVNIISINTPVFFTELNHFSPMYTFVSLANLDLGIQTCFYNGMDDCAKMWLQLAFPLYLIFIAALIIITSRYSTTIQRLTARRALPVLATLFLLSYTKILRIVSSVLFFYSTITHLPSKHTTLVWSVDANVPLFGVRFTILFIVCLILFLILVPFNVILLFTRTLSRFRFINKFKPLLDAYQGPYKDKHYYWTGLQLLIRAMLFGISSLDRNINLTISIILFSILGVLHGVIQPYKIRYKSYQELVLILNLQALYAISLFYQDTNNQTVAVATIMITIVAVQFLFIITYHINTYVCHGVIRNKIQLSVNTLTGWITRLQKESQPQQFQLQDNIRDKIPEVTYNYCEYREPLVGQD